MEWINTKEKLPALGERFLSYINGELIICGAYVGHWEDDFRRECMTLRGQHFWMPLPKQVI